MVSTPTDQDKWTLDDFAFVLKEARDWRRKTALLNEPLHELTPLLFQYKDTTLGSLLTSSLAKIILIP